MVNGTAWKAVTRKGLVGSNPTPTAMKIAAIIPAYNEEATIAQVVKRAKESEHIDEVIVVDDGSFDATAQLAEDGGARVIKLNQNMGKGYALEKGVGATDASILLFLDGDLINLSQKHINLLLEPVTNNRAEMTVGAIDRSNISLNINNKHEKKESPFSGIRVLKKSFWEEIPGEYKKKFYIESAITYFAKKKKLETKPFVLYGVTHLIKEKKLGFREGFKARIKMMGQIIFINTILRITPKKKFKKQIIEI